MVQFFFSEKPWTEVTRCKETHRRLGGKDLATAAAVTDDNIIIIIVVIIADWYSPALSLPCHRPPWAFFKFVLGERGARSEGKQILIIFGLAYKGGNI